LYESVAAEKERVNYETWRETTEEQQNEQFLREQSIVFGQLGSFGMKISERKQ
jgi:hypothetical protein